MTYNLLFEKRALKEWQRLSAPLRDQLKKKLAERLINPHVPSARLRGQANRYKIKLRSAGYRLVYEVRDAEVVILVLAIGKRESNEVYVSAASR